ncbi:hypothetical protein NDN08_007662 [Rhodosorus marinus]|uniref:F-box/LRR-repeat protein 15-like leucin rich repeat domain-containing protein n=1 Tax=Rhodosorus marinus TaxID=101924 RepID=A0AAV8UY67_9RHOD|nr:hypothetical protein NDN08_007662 [Rhodosorus marinus]
MELCEECGGSRGRLDACAQCGVWLHSRCGVRAEGERSPLLCPECASGNDRKREDGMDEGRVLRSRARGPTAVTSGTRKRARTAGSSSLRQNAEAPSDSDGADPAISMTAARPSENEKRDPIPERRGRRRSADSNQGPNNPPSARRQRFRELAEERASNFAVGRGFVDDADRERIEDENDTATAPQTGRTGEQPEVWPGPYSTAIHLLNKRSAAMAAREARSISRKSEIAWTPKGSGSTFKFREPTLMDHCVKRCVDKVEELLEEGLLGEMFPDAKAEVSKELCRQRKFNGEILPHFAEKHTSVLTLPDCSYLTEEDLLSAFGQCQGPGLDQVNLGFCGRGMSDQALATLSTDSSNIRELTLEGCYRLSDNGIEAMLKNLHKLETLDLSSCPRISSKTVGNIVRYAGNTISVLRLRTAAQLSGEDFLPIAELKHLESLCISENTRVDDRSLIHIISKAGSKLQCLNLAGCTELSDTMVSAVAECCPHLEEICLDETQVTDVGLRKLTSECSSLAFVSLRSCSNITDEGCIHMIKNCKIKRLSLNGLYCVTDATVLALKRYCEGLEELDLSWCRAITDEALGQFVDAVQSLRLLKLRGCSQVTAKFVGGHSNPDLEHCRRVFFSLSITPLEGFHMWSVVGTND